MADSYWRTTSGLPRRERLAWPSPAQAGRQLLVVALVGLVWGGLLFGYLRLTGGLAGQEVTRPADGVETVAESGPAQGPVSTSTPIPPSATPVVELTPSIAPTTGVTPAATLVPPPTVETVASPISTPAAPPSPTSTAVPLPSPTLPATEQAAASAPASEPAAPSTETGGAAASFSAGVLPIFERRCVKCHGGEKTEKGLVLTNYADALAGSFDGPVIEPGSATDSYLVELIVSGKMPKNAPHLLPAEIRTISDWINAGAPDN